MKLAPLARAAAARPGIRHVIVHTGQHYDADMSEVFFQELGIPKPDVHLNVGSGTHGAQTAHTGGATLATSTETVANGTECTDAANPVTGTITSFTVPSNGVVDYSIMISGLTAQTCQSAFSAYNSIRNGALDLQDGSHANSPSVAPCGTPPLIPEAPFAALLVLSGGALAVVYFMRRSGAFHLTAPRSPSA